MKRAGNLWRKVVSDENLQKAVMTVCESHRWLHFPDRPNRKVEWLESTFDERIQELRGVLEEGFTPSPVTKKKRYDANAGKWRDIAEPRLWPDQCVHHALIQALEPVLMRGMDYWCLGSIKKRGAHFGIRGIKKWMRAGKGVKYCVEMDIRHFYDSLDPEMVMKRMRRLIKDRRVLDLIWRIVKDGVMIGAYTSQWFANAFLQPLDRLIRESGATKYVRYMDNFTVFTNRKRTAGRIIAAVSAWLFDHGLQLKGNWQKFKLKGRMPRGESRRERMKRRLPNALGYRFGKGFTLMRKKNLLRLKRQLERYYLMRERGRFIPVKFAMGLLSRLGMLRHCNSTKVYERIYRAHTQRQLKAVVREYYRKEMEKWSMSLEPSVGAA